MSHRHLDAFPMGDDEVAAFVRDLGLDGIVDIHVHALPARMQDAVWRFFDSLTDPPWPIEYRLDLDAQLATLADLGVVAHTALAYPHKPGMLDWLNGFTLDLADRVDAVIPTFTLFPEDDVDDAVAAAIGRGGAVVKAHVQVGRYLLADPRLDGAWTQVEEAGVAVLAHVTATYGVGGGDEVCGVDHVRDLLERHPDLTVMIAHVGLPDHADAVALAEETPQVLLDVSGALIERDMHRIPPDVVARMAAIPDQIVFGSDFPSTPYSFADQVRGLAPMELDDAGLRDVLAGTARRLLGSRR